MKAYEWVAVWGLSVAFVISLVGGLQLLVAPHLPFRPLVIGALIGATIVTSYYIITDWQKGR